MARKSDGEKIDELDKIVAAMAERLANVVKSLDTLSASHDAAAALVLNFRRECERDLALLKREIEEVNKWRQDQRKAAEEHHRRLWAFGPNVFGAVISGLIAAVVAYFIARR